MLQLDSRKMFILYYTYACHYNMQVKLLFLVVQSELAYGKIGEWRFDKRSYIKGPPLKNLSLPPPNVPESVVCNIKHHSFQENQLSLKATSEE
uniref:Hydroxyproline O-arabinosyltransferase-like domain-containing protein n=1 Tax=Solanum lycopersicum TaxID=4081 RepID=A0A3Q7H9Y7_SOLLC